MMSKMKSNESEERKITHAPTWHNTVAGGVAGAASRFLVAPLDLLRIRMQLVRHSNKNNSVRHISMWGRLHEIYRSEGGIRSLFRGNVSATYLWITYTAVQFTVYEQLSEQLKELSSSQNTPVSWSSPAGIAFVSGATAGVFATLATYPLDVCRTAFAAKGLTETTATCKPPKTIGEFTLQLYQQQGIRGFFAGSGPAILQIIPYMGLTFGFYDAIMHRQQHAEKRQVLVLNSGMAGAISGGVSKMIVYPLDTLKRRLQVQAFFPTSSLTVASAEYRNMWDCLVTMIRDEGFTSLYKGLTPSVLKTTVATSLSFAFFTLTKTILEASTTALQQKDSRTNCQERKKSLWSSSQESYYTRLTRRPSTFPSKATNCESREEQK